MGTGPRATFGYDIALTEVLEDGERYYVAESGTDRGAELLAMIPGREATNEETQSSERVVERTAASIGRQLDTDGLPGLLAANRKHPRWDEVAERCLTCGNCTMVCPTCFCTTVEDVTDLTGTEARTPAGVGLVLHARFLLRPRRRCPLLAARALPALADAQARDVARPVRQLRVRRLRALHRLVPRRDRHHLEAAAIRETQA